MKVRYLRPVLFLAWQEQDGGYPKASGLLLSWFGRASRGGLLLAVGEKAKGLKVVILRVLINLTNSILLCGEKRGSESLYIYIYTYIYIHIFVSLQPTQSCTPYPYEIVVF